MIADKNLSKSLMKFDFFAGIPILFVVGFVRDLSDFFWRPLKRFFWNFKKSRRAPKPRILIIKYSNITEATQMLPALHLIKKNMKEAHISFMGSLAVGAFLVKSKAVDRAEAFSFSTVMDIMKGSFMMVVDFEKELRVTGIAAALMKAPFAIGFSTVGQYRAAAFDETVDYDLKVSVAQNYWNLAALSCEQCGHSPSSKFEQDSNEIQNILKNLWPESSEKTVKMNLPQNYIVMCPSEPTNLWVDLYEKIKQQNSQTEVLLVGQGGRSQRAVYEPLIDRGATSWVDKLSFEELFQILGNAKKIYTKPDYVYEIGKILNDHVEVIN